jgi:arylsulfatase A-like enzyme
MNTDRPNILFAFADDWGRYASVYAKLQGKDSLNHLIDTPNFDRIANEGALFTNALVPAPSCTPCRSSVLSGRYFWNTRLGAILQGAVWDDQIPTYPRMLQDTGYHTGHTYKTWGPGVPAGISPTGGPERHFTKAGAKFNGFSFMATKAVESGDSIEEAKAPLYQEVRDNFVDFLEQRPENSPFCYWWGPTNTHRSWKKGSGKELWNIDPDDLKGKMPKFFPDVHDVREDVADYLGECLALDRSLGVLLHELEDRGELDNTLIVVSGDHGIPGFPRAKCNLYDIGCEVSLMARLPGAIEPGTIIEDMTNLMDIAPTFLEIAGLSPDPKMDGKSLWGRLTGQIPTKEDNSVVIGRERHVGQAREGNLPYPQRAIRTPDFLYIYNFAPDRWPMGEPQGMDDLNAPPIPWEEIENETRRVYPDLDASPTKAWMIHHRAEPQHTNNFLLGFDKRPKEELYDLKKDPDSMLNVATDPVYETIRSDLKKRLFNLLKNHKDPRVCDHIPRYENSPFTDLLPHSGPETESQAVERLSRSGE